LGASHLDLKKSISIIAGRTKTMAIGTCAHCGAAGAKSHFSCPTCPPPGNRFAVCNRNCQKEFWKVHKKTSHQPSKQRTQPAITSKGLSKDDQYDLHKQEFDKIIAKYKLDAPDKAEAIAELLTNQNDGVSAPAFAEKFGMNVEEAVVFLEWIKVGIKFKEEAIDTAKKAGLGKKS